LIQLKIQVNNFLSMLCGIRCVVFNFVSSFSWFKFLTLASLISDIPITIRNQIFLKLSTISLESCCFVQIHSISLTYRIYTCLSFCQSSNFNIMKSHFVVADNCCRFCFSEHLNLVLVLIYTGGLSNLSLILPQCYIQIGELQ